MERHSIREVERYRAPYRESRGGPEGPPLRARGGAARQRPRASARRRAPHGARAGLQRPRGRGPDR